MITVALVQSRRAARYGLYGAGESIFDDGIPGVGSLGLKIAKFINSMSLWEATLTAALFIRVCREEIGQEKERICRLFAGEASQARFALTKDGSLEKLERISSP